MVHTIIPKVAFRLLLTIQTPFALPLLIQVEKTAFLSREPRLLYVQSGSSMPQRQQEPMVWLVTAAIPQSMVPVGMVVTCGRFAFDNLVRGTLFQPGAVHYYAYPHGMSSPRVPFPVPPRPSPHGSTEPPMQFAGCPGPHTMFNLGWPEL